MNTWKAAILVASNNGTTAITDPALAADALLIGALLEAAPRFDARSDAFAAGKGATCRDIAARAKDAGFASPKQRDFAVKLVEWSKPRPAVVVTADADVTLAAAHLRVAAKAYEAAGAMQKAAVCLDITAKLERFHSFASDAQKAFALALVREAPGGNTLPDAAAPAPERPGMLAVPKLFDVMQKHATLHAGDLKISRKNQDSLCWLVWQGRPVGKIENGTATVWISRLGRDSADALMALLAEFDIDPLAAAQKYGRLSGRCCSCNRDLTDPVSIAAGIGPICAQKF